MTNVVSLDAVRAHLRMPVAYIDDDFMLTQVFIPAADEVIKRECGNVVPESYEDWYDGGDFSIYLRNVPVLSVEMVEEGWGWTNYLLNFVQANSLVQNEADFDPVFAYSIDIPETGKISRRYGGNVAAKFVSGEGNIHVVYTAGLAKVPGNVTLAALELVAHWYQGSQQRGSGQGAGYDVTDEDFTRSQGLSAVNQGVPYRVIELLKPTRRQPIIG